MAINSTFGNVRNLPEPAKEYEWYVTFENAPGDVGGVQDLQLYAQTSSIPGRTHGEVDRNFFNHVVRYAGKKESAGTIDMTFVLHDDMVAYRRIKEWAGVVSDPVSGHPSTATELSESPAYFGTVKTFLASQRGTSGDNATQQDGVKYHQCWPEEVSSVDLDYSGDSNITFDVTWAYSTFEYIENNP